MKDDKLTVRVRRQLMSKSNPPEPTDWRALADDLAATLSDLCEELDLARPRVLARLAGGVEVTVQDDYPTMWSQAHAKMGYGDHRDEQGRALDEIERLRALADDLAAVLDRITVYLGDLRDVDAVLARYPGGVAMSVEQCGAWGGCILPKGHNMGRADVPANHPLDPLQAERALADDLAAALDRLLNMPWEKAGREVGDVLARYREARQ